MEVYQEIARKHDVHTNNEVFKAYVAELAQGFGLGRPAVAAASAAPAAAPKAAVPSELAPPPQTPPPPEVVRGQEMKETPMQKHVEKLMWVYAWLIAAIVLVGIGYQAWRTRRESRTRAALV